MKSMLVRLRNSKGVVMVVAMLIMLAVTAIGLGMITSAAMSSTIAKNYRNKLQSFYASDGQMTVLAQAVIDTLDSNWVGTPTAWDTSYKIEANRGKKYVTLTTDSLDAVGADSVHGASFKIIPSGSHYLIKEVTTTNNYVNVNGTSYLVANNGSSGALFDFPACSACTQCSPCAVCRGGVAISAYGNSKPVVSARTQLICYQTSACNVGDTTAWERYFIKKVITPTKYVGSNVIRNFKVQWSKTLTATKEYTLNTIAYDSLSVWGKVFETTLNQVIDLQYGLLTGSSAASVEIPVTYRDFHEDRTCPEFEAPHTASQYAPSCGNRGCPGTGCSGSNPCNGCDPNYWYRSKWKNMLARNLDSYHKPQLGKYCHSNAYVKYWLGTGTGPTDQDCAPRAI